MLSGLQPYDPQRRLIAVYAGEGAGWRSVRSTVVSLKRLLPPIYEVCCVALFAWHLELPHMGWPNPCGSLLHEAHQPNTTHNLFPRCTPSHLQSCCVVHGRSALLCW